MMNSEDLVDFPSTGMTEHKSFRFTPHGKKLSSLKQPPILTERDGKFLRVSRPIINSRKVVRSSLDYEDSSIHFRRESAPTLG